MDQVINTLSLFAIENGLLTRWVSDSSSTDPEFRLTFTPLSSVALVISLGFVSGNSPYP